MPDNETGLKWWIRYVIVPLIGSGGLIAIIVALISNESTSPISEHDQTAISMPSGEKEPVYTEPIELGMYISGFMLAEGIPRPDWYIGSRTSLPISWHDLSELEHGWEWERKGIARVKVNGAAMKSVFGEVKWEVTVNGTKFGPKSVRLSPLVDECFNTPGIAGCAFDFLPAMRKSGIIANTLCSGIVSGTAYRAALFLVTSKGRRDAYLVYEYDEGSGGASSWVTLYWTNPFGYTTTHKEFCNEFYEKNGLPNSPLEPTQ